MRIFEKHMLTRMGATGSLLPEKSENCGLAHGCSRGNLANEKGTRMKRAALIALALALTASIATAQTQVLSGNAVGYTRLTVPAGNYNLVRLDFNGLDGGVITVSNALGNQLPDGSMIVLWQPALQQYKRLTRARGTWSQGTTVLARGDAFFLMGQTNVGNTNYEVFLMGEVPDRFTAPTSQVSIVQSGGFSFVGYPYPVATAFSNFSLAGLLSNGAVVALWNPAEGYTRYAKARGNWPQALATNVIQPGQGFCVRTPTGQSGFVWSEPKPYTWP